MCSNSSSQFKTLIHIEVCGEIIKYFAFLQMVKSEGKVLGKVINFFMSDVVRIYLLFQMAFAKAQNVTGYYLKLNNKICTSYFIAALIPDL